jgi:hypothetical protein
MAVVVFDHDNRVLYAGWMSTPTAMYSTATGPDGYTPLAARAIGLLAHI